MPPLRKPPTGTSATSCVRRRRRAVELLSRRLARIAGVIGAVQLPVAAQRRASRCSVTGWPAGSLAAGEAGRVGCSRRRGSRAGRAGRSRARSPGSARMALSSEAKAKRPVGGVVERLDAEPVAGEEAALRPGVPDGEGEHAAQAGGRPRPTPRRRAPPPRCRCACRSGARADQVLAQLAEVVDLAVVGDPDRAVRCRSAVAVGRSGR